MTQRLMSFAEKAEASGEALDKHPEIRQSVNTRDSPESSRRSMTEDRDKEENPSKKMVVE